MTFRMPDSYYDPPEYDGCEDCDCEDPEHPEHYTPTPRLDVRGMTDQQVSDALDAQDEVLCDCKCHNIPPDPRDDRPEPDDIPDWYPNREDY